MGEIADYIIRQMQDGKFHSGYQRPTPKKKLNKELPTATTPEVALTVEEWLAQPEERSKG